MAEDFNLDGKVFVVAENEGEDVQLPPGSRFRFRQSQSEVKATYSGGEIVKGELKGTINDDRIHHRFSQTLKNGRLPTRRDPGLKTIHELPHPCFETRPLDAARWPRGPGVDRDR